MCAFGTSVNSHKRVIPVAIRALRPLWFGLRSEGLSSRPSTGAPAGPGLSFGRLYFSALEINPFVMAITAAQAAVRDSASVDGIELPHVAVAN
jgi:hypothetical protein